ncbi:hypothetical protein [Catenulispora rubra]|uniref:hypothetical protein n=1 Tax=Catenulispora rubra TaxID=280293 RepID=UPI0018922534|nr:hypothetical protein [Catenulispora rubra]
MTHPTVNAPAPFVYAGGAVRLMATHEAGHAVVHLLLGQHVIECGIEAVDDDEFEIATGSTTFSGINTTELAELVATAAGEIAARRLLEQAGHPNAAAEARSTAEHDLVHTQKLIADTTLPLGIGAALAEQLVTDYWPAIGRVADALCAAPGHRLDGAGVLAAAALADDEFTWYQLRTMAMAAMPQDVGIYAYLTGAGEEDENDRAEFVSLLWIHNLLNTPIAAPRRQVHAEVFRRGMPALKAELEVAQQAGGAR